MKISAVYVLESPTGIYVGSSLNLDRRLGEHRSRMSRGIHENRTLQSAYNKHGPLVCRALIYCRPCDLLFFEQRAIDILKPRYNQMKIAGRVETTEESRAKKRLRRHSAETRAKMSAMASRPRPPGRKPRAPNLETYAKISVGNRGKKHTAEHKAKIAAAGRGRTATPETRARLSAAKRGRVVSEETRAKLRASGLRFWEAKKNAH